MQTVRVFVQFYAHAPEVQVSIEPCVFSVSYARTLTHTGLLLLKPCISEAE